MLRSSTLLLLLLLLLHLARSGHLVHDFYKCESDFYKAFFKRCQRDAGQVSGAAGLAGPAVSFLLGLPLLLHRRVQ